MKRTLRRAEELGDNDIIEVVKPTRVGSPSRSGTYAAVRPPPLPSRALRRDSGPPTDVSDLMRLLARLSDPGSLPRLNVPMDIERREPAEALILTFVQANMTVEGIVGMSPLGEDSTLRHLANLLEEGAITLAD
jgi:hypothetical protein